MKSLKVEKGRKEEKRGKNIGSALMDWVLAKLEDKEILAFNRNARNLKIYFLQKLLWQEGSKVSIVWVEESNFAKNIVFSFWLCW